MITPKQTAEALQVSTSTLRRWSSDFEPFLSHRKGTKRLYTPDDLAMLSKIKAYFAEGLSTAQIKEALPVVNNSDNDKALVNVPDFANALMIIREDNIKLIETVDILTNRLQALEEYLDLPFYKRLGKRPK